MEIVQQLMADAEELSHQLNQRDLVAYYVSKADLLERQRTNELLEKIEKRLAVLPKIEKHLTPSVEKLTKGKK